MRRLGYLFQFLVVAALLLVPASAAAQYARFDFPEYTINQSAPIPGGMYPMLAFPGVGVQLCSAWNSTTCTALLQTYQTAAGTACPTNAQLVSPQPGSGCSAVTDLTGDVGGFAAPGNYAYFVTTAQGTYGPYQFSVSAGGTYQNSGLFTDARTFGISAFSTDAQNQAGFAALAAAVSAGTTPAHVYVPAPPAFSITAWTISSNVVIFTAPNTLVAGNVVQVRGFGTSNFFNNVFLTVTSASSTQFAASFTHANGSSTEAGTAVPVYSVLSTGSTALGTYNIAIDFECDAADSTIINQTGTGYLIQPGPSGYVEFTNVNFWTPNFIRKCQFTGGASAAGGVYYPAGADGLILTDDYFLNFGSASNWAVTSTGSNELEINRVSYMRTDQVLGNFVRQPLTLYNLLLMRDNRIVCTTSTTNGASVPCGIGVWASGNLEFEHNLVSGPIPAVRCDGDGGNATTCSINNNLLEAGGPGYLVQFGDPAAGGNQYTYNFSVKNNRIELNGTNFGFVGPTSATYSGLNTADISYNTLREDATTTLPAVVLNNIGGQGHLQGLGNIGWAYIHNLGTNIPPFTINGLANDGSVVLADSGAALTLSSALGLANDTFGGTALQPSWVVTGGSFTIGSNRFSGNNAATSLAYWNGGNFPNDQWAEFLIGGLVAGSEIGVGVRLQSGSESGYMLTCTSTQLQIWKVASGTRTALGTAVSISFSGGQDVRLSVVGTLLTAYWNGVAVQTITDTTYTSGQPGIAAFGNSGSMYGTFWDAPGPLYKSNAQGYYTGYGTASFVAGAGAGTSPGSPSCFAGYTCDSKHGVISMTTGSGPPTSGTVLTITLGGATRPTNAVCTIVAMNTSTGALTPLYTANSTTTTCVGSAPGVSLSASQAYAFSYTVD